MSKTPGKGSLLVIFLTVFIDLLGFGIVLPLLPIYAEQFKKQEAALTGQAEAAPRVGDDERTPESALAEREAPGADVQGGLIIGLLMSCFSAMQFFFSPFWGRISDRVGRRPVLMVGLAGSVAFYALFGVATETMSLTLLFVARIGAGIAGATIPTAQAYIADSTPLEKRGKGMALIGAAFGGGFVFGPLLAFFAVSDGESNPGPWPGYLAALLSLTALVLAYLKLPESLTDETRSEALRKSRRVFDWAALSDALKTPSVGMLIASSFVCVFAFANLESTLSLLLKHEPFGFETHDIALVFVYIGATLTVAQGFLVRRLSGKVADSTLAASGCALEIAGLGLSGVGAQTGSLPLLMTALMIAVVGFALLTPSLNSMISRRSDPARQGGVLGVAQSMNSLARILGPMIGVTLVKASAPLPYWLGAGLMVGGMALVLLASRGGRDYAGASQA